MPPYDSIIIDDFNKHQFIMVSYIKIVSAYVNGAMHSGTRNCGI